MYTQRSQEKELLDLGPDYYNHNEYVDCLKKLFSINKVFGFFQDTVKILKKFSKQSSVLDIGCGGGLFLLHLSKHFPEMHLLGVDISAEAIQQAQYSLEMWQKTQPMLQVSFKIQPQHELQLAEGSVDVILLTLVCHHLHDLELVTFLQQTYLAAKKAVIINDLHRHRIAGWFYALLSPFLFRNRLITHDGLISIRRGFSRVDWCKLLQKAGIKNYTLKWRFPFRWQVILWK